MHLVCNSNIFCCYFNLPRSKIMQEFANLLTIGTDNRQGKGRNREY
jgi:hypothetical protein